jgi:hypothetical protein
MDSFDNKDLVATEECKSNYVWEGLSEDMNKKLLTTSIVVGSRDDGDGGGIELALTQAGCKITIPKIKRCVTRYINNMTTDDFVEMKRKLLVTGKNKREFVNNIMRRGFDIGQDNGLEVLTLLSNAIKMDMIVLNNSCDVIVTSDQRNDKVVMLNYTGCKYKAMGVVNKSSKVKSIFNKDKMPNDLEVIKDRKLFLTRHFDNIVRNANSVKVTLNYILLGIESVLQHKLDEQDMKDVMGMIKEYVTKAERDFELRT